MFALVLIASVNPWPESLGADPAGASPAMRPPVLPRAPVSVQASRTHGVPVQPISRPSGPVARPTPPGINSRAAFPVPAYSGADRSGWSENAAKARRDSADLRTQMEVKSLSTNSLQRRAESAASTAKGKAEAQVTEVNLQRLVRYFGNPSPALANTNAGPAFNPPLKGTGPQKPTP